MTGSAPKCLMSCAPNGTPLRYSQVLGAHPSLVRGYHLGGQGHPASVLRALASLTPRYAETARGSVLLSCQELAQCPGGAPLAWGVCGQAAAPLLPGTGEGEEGDEPVDLFRA